jgi:hypothetical protein
MKTETMLLIGGAVLAFYLLKKKSASGYYDETGLAVNTGNVVNGKVVEGSVKGLIDTKTGAYLPSTLIGGVPYYNTPTDAIDVAAYDNGLITEKQLIAMNPWMASGGSGYYG